MMTERRGKPSANKITSEMKLGVIRGMGNVDGVCMIVVPVIRVIK